MISGGGPTHEHHRAFSRQADVSPVRLITWLSGFLFFCQSHNFFNILYCYWSHFSSYFKRTAICVVRVKWNSLFFIIFMVCQFVPSALHSETVNPGQVGQEISYCGVVPVKGSVGHNLPSVVSRLDESVQFWTEGINNFTADIGTFVLLGSGICQPVVDENGNKKYDNTGKAELTCSDNWLAQVIFLTIVIPAVFSIFIISAT